MSGEKKSLQEQIEARDDYLDSFESGMGLPALKQPANVDDLDKYLTMSIIEITSLDQEDCANISHILKQWSFYITRCQNRCSARLIDLKNRLDKMVAKSHGQHSGSWEMQRQKAIMEDSAAQKLQTQCIAEEQKIARLHLLSNRISDLSDSMKSILYTKRKPNE